MALGALDDDVGGEHHLGGTHVVGHQLGEDRPPEGRGEGRQEVVREGVAVDERGLSPALERRRRHDVGVLDARCLVVIGERRRARVAHLHLAFGVDGVEHGLEVAHVAAGGYVAGVEVRVAHAERVEERAGDAQGRLVRPVRVAGEVGAAVQIAARMDEGHAAREQAVLEALEVGGALACDLVVGHVRACDRRLVGGDHEAEVLAEGAYVLLHQRDVSRGVVERRIAHRQAPLPVGKLARVVEPPVLADHDVVDGRGLKEALREFRPELDERVFQGEVVLDVGAQIREEGGVGPAVHDKARSRRQLATLRIGPARHDRHEHEGCGEHHEGDRQEGEQARVGGADEPRSRARAPEVPRSEVHVCHSAPPRT